MISIVIPHYDDVGLLRKNVPVLVKMLSKSGLAYEIIISDDCSPDEVFSELSDFVDKLANDLIRIVRIKKNRGFGNTVNRGVEAAVGEIVFVLKADVVPTKAEYFKFMTDHFIDPTVFAVSSALVTIEDGVEQIRGQGMVVFFRGLFQHFRTRADFNAWLLTNRTTKRLASSEEVVKKSGNGSLISAWPDGGSSAYRRELFLQLGGFEELLLPFYWEDTDIGYRAWKAGYKVHFEERGILKHEYREGTIARHYKDNYLLELNYRNQFLFVALNSDFRHLVEALLWSFYHLLIAAKAGNWSLIKGFLRTLFKAYQINKARIVRRRRSRLTDDEVLAIFKKI